MKVAIVGAGWAGCTAAVEACRLGHQVTLFEAARLAGGRARRVEVTHDGRKLTLDNGQHILIGAYSECLQLMAELGVDLDAGLLRLPLTMRFPDRSGLQFPKLPTPLDALAGILGARGWSWRDKASLLRASLVWKKNGFKCAPQLSVTELCNSVSATVMATLIEPLCVSALNTPPERASGAVFLRVLRDALFSVSAGSNLLLPRADLSALLPDAALAWLAQHGGQVRLGTRVQSVRPAQSGRQGAGWTLSGDPFSGLPVTDTLGNFDAVVLACQPTEAARLAAGCGTGCEPWRGQARALKYEAIATVYAFSPATKLAEPMLALRSSRDMPAQFVFDRGQLGGEEGLLAFVVSTSQADAATLAAQVQAQAQAQLGLSQLQLVQTIVEKRATFACTPGLQRPAVELATGLLACGDYVDGPYPATLEGAVRSGLEAARRLGA